LYVGQKTNFSKAIFKEKLMINKSKQFLVGIVLALVAVALSLGGITAVKVVQAQSDISTNANYYFGNWQPGYTYHVQFVTFQRYGPLKNAIESQTGLLFGPETSIRDGSIEIDKNGVLKNFSMVVTSIEGEPWYVYSSLNNDEYTVKDFKANKQIALPNIPQNVILNNEKDRLNYIDLFTQLGYKVVKEGSFNGQHTLVFSYIESSQKPQEPPGAEEYFAPVTYDLKPINFRDEIEVDSSSGVVLRSHRYAIDTFGKETLIQSFSLQKLTQDS
jgi:hypothetical protein